MKSATKTAAPTKQSYNELQTAYSFFNKALFGGTLPDCLITLQRKSHNVRGYYSPGRFVQVGNMQTRTDEIAINPQRFVRVGTDIVLSTLVHEMVHLWQQHQGTPSRKAYHNKQWAEKMKSVGLHPSHTGEVGGNETGQKVTHYIIKNGPFAVACAKLLKGGFKLTWGEVAISAAQKVNTSNRVKYTCEGCGCNVWGKPELNINCGDCEVPFEVA